MQDITPRDARVARRSWRWAALAVIVVAAFAYAAVPRRADLTRFDAAAMAQLETAMWRNYYAKRYAALFADLYWTARSQQGFSPLASLRIAVAAARAAKAFQPSASRREAEQALPFLRTYFALLAEAAPVAVDVDAAAEAELDWWQARREAAAARDYGLTIARVSSRLYGVDNIAVRQSGIERAEAMEFRDRRGPGITEADWHTIEDRLRVAYTLLRRALDGPRPDPPSTPAR